MIIEGDYYYEGARRLSWGFASPNQLGACLAMLLPLAWGGWSWFSHFKPRAAFVRTDRRKPSDQGQRLKPSILVGGLVAIELFLWGCLGATASRGGAVAAVMAAGVWAWFASRWAKSRWLYLVGWLGGRCLVCIVALAAFSFGGRIAPEYLAKDRSVGNRFVLWKAGAELVAVAPLKGWGVGDAGSAMGNWTQPLDRQEIYRSMVNSYLEIAVERGLPMLALASTLIMALAAWPLLVECGEVPAAWRAGFRVCACIWVAWAVANVFSTLADDSSLWVLPAGAAVGLLVSLWWRSHFAWRNWACWVILFGLGIPLMLWAYGSWKQAHRLLRISRPDEGSIELRSRDASDVTPEWRILPDSAVLGKSYGHAIRRWGEEASVDGVWRVTVYDLRRWQPTAGEYAGSAHWLLVGDAAELADDLTGQNFVVFLHPRGPRPSRWQGKGLIIMNGIDEENSRMQWERWAKQLGLSIKTVTDTGIDARANWPDSYVKLLRAVSSAVPSQKP